MNTYKTADIAKMIGIHVNTVRLYEDCGLISKPERAPNGYRIFTDIHLEQFRLARAALKVEVLQNGLRRQAVDIIKASAAGEYKKAEQLIQAYVTQIEAEKSNAEEAIKITRSMLSTMEKIPDDDSVHFTRREAAEHLGVTMDTLRNWELNGLFSIKRKANGYRVYTTGDIQRLKIIRALRCANYSLSSILRMLGALSADPQADIRRIIDTPHGDEDIITACDRLLTSLHEAGENARFAAAQIEKLKNMSK